MEWHGGRGEGLYTCHMINNHYAYVVSSKSIQNKLNKSQIYCLFIYSPPSINTGLFCRKMASTISPWQSSISGFWFLALRYTKQLQLYFLLPCKHFIFSSMWLSQNLRRREAEKGREATSGKDLLPSWAAEIKSVWCFMKWRRMTER